MPTTYDNRIKTMQTNSKPVFFGREDTMLGICESVGQDFGFNPNWLRVAFGAVLVLNPVMVIASYFALGLLVLVSRLAVRSPKTVAMTEADVVTLSPRAKVSEPVTAEREFALAA
jgi:phage shock protein C